jgi:hypothetical protein
VFIDGDVDVVVVVPGVFVDAADASKEEEGVDEVSSLSSERVVEDCPPRALKELKETEFE